MERKFEYQSDEFTSDGLCNVIEVTITLDPQSIRECWFDVAEIFDKTANVVRQIRDLTQDEWDRIVKLSREVADKYGAEAYQEYLAGQAESRRDSMEDR